MPLSEEEIQQLLKAMSAGEISPRIQKAKFAPLTPVPVQKPEGGIERLADIPLKLRAELGRRRLTVREILELAEGSVISLNKLAGDQVELYANGYPLARGEVMVINDTFSIRINSFITQTQDEGH
ncbi:MAG: flagellar motor switch protein FliN [Clostridia bacterium]|nr:flagellar motor switch protein FliN [Clostridia bacterium]